MTTSGDVDGIAKAKLRNRFGVRRELRKLPSVLAAGEALVNLASGQYGSGTGLVVVTDRRILFFEEGLTRHRLEDFPYARVSSVQSERGVMFGKLTIFASGNLAVIEQVIPKERATEIADYVRGRLAPPSESAAVSPSDELVKLAGLRDAGIVTVEEFEAKKAELLARM